MRIDLPWHSEPHDELVAALETDLHNGLTDEAAQTRRQQFGDNRLSRKKQTSLLVRFLLQFHQPLVYILLAAASVTLVMQEWVDTIVILAVVLINSFIGFAQEVKAINAIDALSNSLTSKATVRRNGKRMELPAEQLVPGDIVLLQAGDKVPADVRIVESKSLQIDESALTGESVPVQKHIDALAGETPLGDRKNCGFSSTLVTYGTGIGVVTGIGDGTEIGKISQLIASTETLDTPLTKRIKQFSHVLLYAIIFLAVLTFVVGWLHGEPLMDTFMAAVALAVGAIPEGLPAAVTIMLAIGVSRMAQRRAIIRHLPAVETLGSTTVICSDKTGTLTKNQMTVQWLWSAGQPLKLSGTGYSVQGDLMLNDQSVTLPELPNQGFEATLLAGVLCNDADVGPGNTANDDWSITGDPTEAALLISAQKAGLSAAQCVQQFPRIDAIPFQSEYQYMATLHQNAQGNTLYVKGSVEKLLPRCHAMLGDDGAVQALDAARIMEQVETYAADGLRVLMFARKTIASSQTSIDHVDVEEGLEFVGLQAMIDPPREEAMDAVAACQQAGIAVKMITGDHALTAASIARSLGISRQAGLEDVITGVELDALNDQQLDHVVMHKSVFARVSPANKLQLVEALQRKHQVVSMTGDGVNDAPALKRADIGVAMAKDGTEVARDASDMMLTDDNFATIRSAVEEGRGVFDNLKKFIVWTLPTNGGEAMVILLAVLLGVSLPLLPLHILWVNMTTAIFLGLMLAFEPKEAGIMQRAPHKPDAPILDMPLLWRIILVSSLLTFSAFGLYELELVWGASETQARTVAVTMFVVGEAFYLFNCRSLNSSVFKLGLFSNPWIWFGILTMLVLQLLFIYLPVMNLWFDTAAISLQSWVRILACGVLLSVIVGFEKWWRNRKAAPLANGTFRQAE